jgi:hypothetical protein
MKLKCAKCGTIVNKRKEVFDRNVKILGIDPEDYKTIYHCRHCRPGAYLYWYTISELSLPEQFLEKYKDKIDWYRYLAYHKVTEEFIEKYTSRWPHLLKWSYVIKTQKLTEEFLEKHSSKFNNDDWVNLWVHQSVSPEFIQRHIDTAHWGCISECQQLPEWFIDKYADKVNWNSISISQKLSPEFITEHIDKITEDILRNEEFDNYPDSIKLLLKQKFK